MDLLGIILMLVLSAIGAIHLSWALGSQWPGVDPVSLHARVVGTPGYVIITRWMWALIAACFFAGVGVVWLGNAHPAHWGGVPIAPFVCAGYAVLILVFGLRGLSAYVTNTFRYARTTPFYTLNRRYYAPLCLLIAAGLVLDFPGGLAAFLQSLF